MYLLKWLGILLALLVVTVGTLLMSSGDTKIIGAGHIDLGTRQVDLTLKPAAKELSLFSADAPIQVQGPWHDLSLSTNIGKALWSLATPIETGQTQQADCQALLGSTGSRGCVPHHPKWFWTGRQ